MQSQGGEKTRFQPSLDKTLEWRLVPAVFLGSVRLLLLLVLLLLLRLWLRSAVRAGISSAFASSWEAAKAFSPSRIILFSASCKVTELSIFERGASILSSSSLWVYVILLNNFESIYFLKPRFRSLRKNRTFSFLKFFSSVLPYISSQLSPNVVLDSMSLMKWTVWDIHKFICFFLMNRNR